MKKLLSISYKVLCAILLFVASSQAQLQVNGDPAVVAGHGWDSSVLNDTGTGTTLNLLAKIAVGKAIKAGTSDTAIETWIVMGGAGTSLSAQLAHAGQAKCIMDATNASGASGWFVLASTTTAGRCHAQSTAPNGWVVGTLFDDATTSGSTATVIVNGSFNLSGAGSGTVTSVATSSPISGGPVTGTGTISCPTCIFAASSLADLGIVIGTGGLQGSKTVAGLSTDGVSIVTLGVAGASVGEVDFKNATSGTIALKPVTGALGTVTLSLPAATDTLLGRATTDTLSNKTLDNTNIFNSFHDVTRVAAPANPASGSIRLYADSTSGNLSCLTSAGANCLPGGSSRWDQLTNPSGNLTLSIGTNLSEWDYSTGLASAWKITNTTAATVTTPQNSPVLLLCGQEWTGAGASTEGCFKRQFTPGTGLNAASLVTFTNTTASTSTHNGWSFDKQVFFADGNSTSPSISFANATGSGFARNGLNVTSYSNGGANGVFGGLGTGNLAGFYANQSLGLTTSNTDICMTRSAASVMALGDCSANANAAGILFHRASQFNETTAPTTVAATGMVYDDSTAHEYKASTNGSSSFGLLVRSEPSPINQTAQTAAISTATLCAASAGACNVAGQYHIHFDFWGSGTACSSVTAGSVTFLLTWTDENAVTHSAVAEQMIAQTGAATTAVQASFPFQTALANESGSGDVTISTNGTVIQYATGYTACTTGTGTYNLRAAATRIQ